MYMYTYMCTHTSTHPLTHTHTHRPRHTRTHTHTYTHAHTNDVGTKNQLSASSVRFFGFKNNFFQPDDEVENKALKLS